jgi:hypothetical protein
MHGDGSRRFLTLAIAAIPLLTLAAAAGLAWPGLYRDPASLAPQLQGQDCVTLVVAVPALVAAVLAALRGAVLGPVVSLGVLAYTAYSYALYAFGVRHNEMFLVYVALLGVSVWGIVAGVASTDGRALAAAAARRLAWRRIGGTFVGLAALFAALWLADLVPALVRRETPATVVAWGTPTNAVHVLDLALVLPLLAWTGVRLWRRDVSVVVVTGVLLFKIVTLGLALLAMAALQVGRGQRVEPGLVAVFAAMTAAAMVAAAHYARAVTGRSRA